MLYLKEIPLLTQPEIGKPLYMYLAVSNTIVSVVLLKKIEQVDCPIYYVGRVF